jgi:hypothetical protein
MVGITLAERITRERNTMYDDDELELVRSITSEEQKCFADPNAVGANLEFGKQMTEEIFRQKNRRR